MTRAFYPFAVIDPVVIDVSASLRSTEESFVTWFVGFAPEAEVGADARVVFATLHGSGESGGAEATVACMVRVPDEQGESSEKFKNEFLESDAVQTLYDITRIAFRSVAAISGVVIDVPKEAPEPETGELVRRAPSDEEVDEATGSPE